MTAAPALVRTFEVAGFTAEVSVPRLQRGVVGSAVVEWSPRVPDFNRDFSKEQRLEYRLKLIGAINEVMA